MKSNQVCRENSRLLNPSQTECKRVTTHEGKMHRNFPKTQLTESENDFEAEEGQRNQRRNDQEVAFRNTPIVVQDLSTSMLECAETAFVAWEAAFATACVCARPVPICACPNQIWSQLTTVVQLMLPVSCVT